MSRYVLLICTSIIFCSGCSGQGSESSSQVEKDHTIESMPKRVESFPFEVIGQVSDTVVIDSLSHRFSQGKILVRMAVNASGKIKFINLMRAALYDREGAEVLTYFNPTAEAIPKQDYPEELDYIHGELLNVFLKDQQFKPEEDIVLYDGFDTYNRARQFWVIFQ